MIIHQDIEAPPVSHRREEKERKRRRILEAAEAVFSSRGFHDASMSEIARHSEFAAGTIYLYFEDKAALYGDLILEKMKEMVSLWEAALSSSRSSSQCLLAAVQAQFGFHDSNRHFFEIFLQHHQVQTSPLHESHWQEMETLKRRNLRAIEKCIARGQKSGELKPGPARLFAVAFLGITLQIIRQEIREKTPGRLVDSADFAVNCFLHGAATASS